MVRSPLRVWVLSDDQPGHYNLSRGIVAALRRIQPVEESWVTMKLRVGLGRNLLRAYLNRVHKPSSSLWLRLFYKMNHFPAEACDLIVSAGGKTSFANAWLAQCMGVPNVYAGSLRRLSSQLFSVVLTLEPIEGAAGNLVLDLPPSAIDFDALQIHGKRFLDQLGLGEQRCWTLMIGGNGAGYRYRRQDWQTLGRMMNALARRYAIRWLLVSSRRTGKRAEQVLRHNMDQKLLAARSWYDEGDGDGFRAEAWLGAAERVFVSEDSMTMLTEAIYSRRPVVSLKPRHAAPTDRYERMVQGFADAGYLCRYALAELSQQPELLGSRQCRVLEASPLDDLAEQLGKRLGMIEAAINRKGRGRPLAGS
ncbi:MAG: ELM1/GtrOC1 family putative glycosyltransferase [Pseudomonadota bacterium]|nr:ELM1/GtrOC1 family putative glycosyltransferase [Pseudomonadota bacterium]